MSVQSPINSPTVHVNSWSDHQVSEWLAGVGLSKYAKDFKANGITGDVLVLLDDDALKDIGVVTIGQRLSLLSAIYRLKIQYGIPIQDGDWVPKSVEAQDGVQSSFNVARMASALRQRDDRIRLLESQIFRLADYLNRFQLDMAAVARHIGVKAHSADTPITLVSNSLHSHHSSEGSLPSMSAFGSNSDLASTASSYPVDSPTSRNFAGLVSPSRAAFAPGNNASGHSYAHSHSGSLSGFKPANLTGVRGEATSAPGYSANAPMTPTSSGMHPQAHNVNAIGPADLSPTQSTPSATPTSLIPQTSISSAQASAVSNGSSANIVSPTRRLAHHNNGSSNLASSNLAGPSSTTSASASNDRENRSIAKDSSGTSSAPSSAGSLNATSSDSNPYKSFRVTLDDPCYKVLPAALKKYKINDDWRKYALFICYGKTERCLSYDEKPLLLFQKLKENEQSPVFMLRHIRDVKSPIAIAEAKAASKSQEKDGGSSSGQKKRSPPRNDGRRIIAGLPPPGALVTNSHNPVEVGPAADLPEHTKQAKTYAVAIYPYMPERDDEFDVNVGDTFVVINKAKGWWIVQRDRKGDGAGDTVYSVPAGEDPTDGPVEGASNYRAEALSGWVPAGCLLETSRPLGSIVDSLASSSTSVPTTRARSGSTSTSGPSTPTVATSVAALERKSSAIGSKVDARRASIPPSLITSTSTPGIMLMDYQSAEGDLDLKKDERLRVFKRYNHWSYCVQERDGHARGWVPSWYIGKLSSSSSSTSAGSRDTTGLSKSTSNHALHQSTDAGISKTDTSAVASKLLAEATSGGTSDAK